MKRKEREAARNALRTEEDPDPHPCFCLVLFSFQNTYFSLFQFDYLFFILTKLKA
jgi:hypothetical protein